MWRTTKESPMRPIQCALVLRIESNQQRSQLPDGSPPVVGAVILDLDRFHQSCSHRLAKETTRNSYPYDPLPARRGGRRPWRGFRGVPLFLNCPSAARFCAGVLAQNWVFGDF